MSAAGFTPLLDILGYRDWAREVFRLLGQSPIMADWTMKFCETIESTRFAHLTVAVGWSDMIPEQFYTNRPTLVAHPSPLPLYRGGSPIQHQIMAGETTSAVTIFKLDRAYPEVDSGPIGWSHVISLAGDLDVILTRVARATVLGIEAMSMAYRREWAGGDPVVFRPQDDREATVYRRRRPSESKIPEGLTALQLHNFVRALQDPYPNAYIEAADGRRVYITRTHLDPEGTA